MKKKTASDKAEVPSKPGKFFTFLVFLLLVVTLDVLFFFLFDKLTFTTGALAVLTAAIFGDSLAEHLYSLDGRKDERQ